MSAKAKAGPGAAAKAKARASASPARAGAARLSASAKPKAKAVSSPRPAGVPAKIEVEVNSPADAKPEPQEAATAEAEAGPRYEGRSLDVKTAELFIQNLAAPDMESLARSVTAEEQLPARMMLEFCGDKDHSWENARQSLLTGASFKKEILDMGGAEFVTKKSIERMEALGPLDAFDPNLLRDRNQAAFAMAIYLQAVLELAMTKLGLKVSPLEPEPEGEPPTWPITIPMGEIPAALAAALKWKRTPLFVCNGKAKVVDTYFSYQGNTLVDAKWILNKVDVSKELSVSQMQEQLRGRLVSAIKFGQPIQICMSNSAVTLSEKYCADDTFPEKLFKQDLWFDQANYSKVIRESDLADWPGAFPGRMRDGDASYAFVTTDFNIDSAREYLPAVLPYFSDMAIIVIDPTSIDA